MTFYTGGTTVSSGTLIEGSVRGIPDFSAATVADGATLQLNGYSLGLSSLTGTGSVIDGASSAATLTIISGTLQANLADGGSGSLALQKSGTGTLTIGSTHSGFTGGTIVAGGKLQFDADNTSPLGSGSVILDPGAILDALGSSITVASLVLQGGIVAGTGGGTIALTTTGAAVTLNAEYPTATPAISANLALIGSSGGSIVKAYAGSSTNSPRITGAIDLGSTSHTITLQDTPTDVAELTLSGPISGTGSLNLDNGAGGYSDWGTLELTNSLNTYSGGTTLSSGRLVVGSSGALGSGAVSIRRLGALSLATSGTATFANALNIARTGDAGANYQLDLSNLSGSNIWAGPISLIAGASAEVSVANGTALTLAGNITDAGSGGSLVSASDVLPSFVAGATSATGHLIVSGNNNYTGATVIARGLWSVGSSNALSNVSGITVATGANLQLEGHSISIGSLSGGGTISDASQTSATLTTGTLNATTTFSGVLADGAGGGLLALAQVGTGTLTLSGTGTYAGGTMISSGKLAIDRQTALGSGRIVLGGGTLGLLGQNPGGSGLLQGRIDGNPFDTVTPNSQGSGSAGFTQGEDSTLIGAGGSWSSNQTWVYTGQFYTADGTVAFAKNIDDSTLVTIDGQVYLDNTTYNQPATTGRLYLTPGWHDIEVRFGNGGGLAGPVSGNGWIAGGSGVGYGFGMATDASSTWSNIPLSIGIGNGITSIPAQGTDYFDPIDTGNATLLRSNGFNLEKPDTAGRSRQPNRRDGRYVCYRLDRRHDHRFVQPGENWSGEPRAIG